MINEAQIIGVKEKRILFLGSLNFKKGPMLLVHAFKAIHDYDSEFTLHIFGELQDPRAGLFLDTALPDLELQNAVEYYGHVDNPRQWMKHYQFCIVSSPLEGSPVGLLECCAEGLSPLIYSFCGAKEQYPAKYTWKSIPDLIEMVKQGPKNSEEIKQFVRDNYSLSKQLGAIEGIVQETLAAPSKKKRVKKTISAVMAVKNGEKTVRQALNSLFKQTRPLKEIIVVNDGSTDNTVQIVRDIGKTSSVPLKIISLSPSKWVFAARSEGVAEITSDYFFFLDADDIVEPTYAAELGAVLDLRQDVDIVYSDLSYFNEKNETKVYPVPDFNPEILTGRNFIAYSAMQRTKKFRTLGGYNLYLNDSRNHLTEWDLWLRAVQQGFGFQHVNKTLFHYFKSSNSAQMSENYAIARPAMHLQMAEQIMGGYHNIQMSPDKERIVLVCQGKDYCDRSKVGFELYTWAKPLEMNGQYEVYPFQYDVEIEYGGIKGTLNRLINYLQLIQPKYVFHPIYQDVIPIEIWKKVSAKWATICWHSDEWRYDNFGQEYEKGFRYSVTTYPSVYEKMRHSGKILSQWAANTHYFKPGQERSLDVSFCGQKYGNRKEMLDGLDVACYGLFWPNGFVDFEDMAAVLGKSKISIAFSQGATGQRQLKLRPFEITAAGALCLCETMPGIEEFFQIGKEIVCFDSKEELVKSISYYLHHEDKLGEIAENGYNRTMHDHTWEQRLGKIFEEINNA